MLLAIAALTSMALVVPLVQAQAAPTVARPHLNASFGADHRSVVASLRDGAFRIDAAGTALQVVDRKGRVIDTMPLTGTMDGFRVPLRANVSADRTTATFAPVISADYRAALDAAATRADKKQRAKPKSKRITKAQRYDMMWKELNAGWKGNTPVSTLIGGLIGFVVFGFPGAAIGAGIGAYLGYQTSNPKAWPAVVTWWNTP